MSVDLGSLHEALPAYEIEGEIGRGGFGVVYKGIHRQLGRRVAVKELPRAFGSNQSVRERFVTEARLLASLDHPHIVPVYDYVERDGICLLVMEWLPGGTVWDRFSTRGVSAQTACAVVITACSGLHFAHQRGVLHRDIKPENLVFNDAGVLKVTDFGIARVIGGQEALATRAGEVLGTPAYMAPEQITTETLGPYTDVYQAGTMLYELVSGRLPFDFDNPMAVLYAQVNESPPHIAEVAAQTHSALAEVIMRSIAKSPAGRFGSAEALGTAVADAAVAAWGPDWLSHTEIQLMDTGTMFRGATGDGTPARSPQTVVSAPPPPTPQTVTSKAPEAASAGAERASQPRVRPTEAGRAHVKAAVAASPSELVPARRVIELPSSRVPALIALGLLAACAIVALLAPGSTTTYPLTLDAGELEVAGTDLTEDRTVPIDFAEPITVSTSDLPRSVRRAVEVRIVFSVIGIKLGSPSEQLGGRGGAELDATGSKFLALDGTKGDLQFLREDRVLGSQAFTMLSEQPAYLTIPFAATVALLLFAFAYAESFMRTLRRGNKTVGPTMGVAFVGLLVGVTLTLGAWLLTGVPPTVPIIVVCGILGLAAGFLAARAAAAVGVKRRLLRRAARQSMQLQTG